MQKDTSMLRVSKKDLLRFKKVAYRHEMSMIEFFSYLVDKVESKKITEDL